jgi:competence protein ComEC
MRGTNSDPNNNSLILRATVAGRTVLLAGDAETEEQSDVVERLGAAALRADVLKVAHHGSALQSPELLDAVDPAIALVSVGAGNDYGHPNASVLARLARDGARVMRTDQLGDVAVVLAGGSLARPDESAHPARQADLPGGPVHPGSARPGPGSIV